jgi:hypothetical protein
VHHDKILDIGPYPLGIAIGAVLVGVVEDIIHFVIKAGRRCCGALPADGKNNGRIDKRRIPKILCSFIGVYPSRVR